MPLSYFIVQPHVQEMIAWKGKEPLKGTSFGKSGFIKPLAFFFLLASLRVRCNSLHIQCHGQEK